MFSFEPQSLQTHLAVPVYSRVHVFVEQWKGMFRMFCARHSSKDVTVVESDHRSGQTGLRFEWSDHGVLVGHGVFVGRRAPVDVWSVLS